VLVVVPEVGPAGAFHSTEVVNLHDGHAALAHEQHARVKVENLDAVGGALDHTAAEFLARTQGRFRLHPLRHVDGHRQQRGRVAVLTIQACKAAVGEDQRAIRPKVSFVEGGRHAGLGDTC
jgi:hypothetical protein